jgi:hypothetical protein
MRRRGRLTADVDTLWPAVVSVLIGGAIGWAGRWWFDRRRWQPKQQEVVSRILLVADAAIKALEKGQDPDLETLRSAVAEAEMILPRLLRSTAQRVLAYAQVASAGLEMRRSRRARGDDDGVLDADARMRAALKDARAARTELAEKTRGHIGLGSG